MLSRTFLCSSIAAVSLVATLSVAQAQTDGDGGQMAFNNACRTCHSVKEGDNRLGPSLYGIVGKKAGTASGFESTPSMRNSGIVWDVAKLDAFIADPDAVVPGNGMKPFGGIGSAEERKKITSYLASAGSN